MQRREFLILIVAILFGIAGFVMILNFLKNSSKPVVRAVLAAQPLVSGQTLTDSDVTLSEPRKDLPAADIFFQPSDVIGTVLMKDVEQGAPIYRNAVSKPLVPAEELPPIPVPYGMKSFTLSAREFDSLPQLQPGTYVDVLGTAPNFEGRSEIQTLIKSVQVVSFTKDPEGQVQIVVLAVSPKAAETLIRAISAGKLRLITGEEGPEKIIYQPPAYTEIIRGVVREKYKSAADEREEVGSSSRGVR